MPQHPLFVPVPGTPTPPICSGNPTSPVCSDVPPPLCSDSPTLVSARLVEAEKGFSPNFQPLRVSIAEATPTLMVLVMAAIAPGGLPEAENQSYINYQL